MSAPILLNTILQMAQLTAFLTSSCSSKSRALSPVCVYLLIFDSPSLVERRSPSKRVAYLRMLTTLQWLKAEASPTHPCSIMLPGSMNEYFFMLNRRPFSWEWWVRWCSGRGWGSRWVKFRWVWGWSDQKQPCRPRWSRISPWRGVQGRGVSFEVVMRWCGVGRIA